MKNFKTFRHFFIFELNMVLSPRNLMVLCILGILLAVFLGAGGEKTWGFGDFRGWLFIMSAFMQMIYGYNLFHRYKNPAFLKMLMSFTSRRQTFWSMLLARLAILILIPLTLVVMIGLLLPFQSPGLNIGDYVYLGHCFLALAFLATVYFMIGAVAEMIFPRTLSRLVMTLLFLLLAVLPLGLKKNAVLPLTTTITLEEKNNLNLQAHTLILKSNLMDTHFWQPKNTAGEDVILYGMVSILILGVMSMLCYKSYCKRLFSTQEVEGPPAEIQLQCKKGELKIIQIRDNRYAKIFFTLLSGFHTYIKHSRANGNIHFYEQEMEPEIDFLYLCPPEALPGEITVGDLLEFIYGVTHRSSCYIKQLLPTELARQMEQKIASLNPDTRGQLLLLLAEKKECSLYYFHDTARQTSLGFTVTFLEMMERLRNMGKSVLYVTTDLTVHVNEARGDVSSECEHWPHLVHSMNEAIST